MIRKLPNLVAKMQFFYPQFASTRPSNWEQNGTHAKKKICLSLCEKNIIEITKDRMGNQKFFKGFGLVLFYILQHMGKFCEVIDGKWTKQLFFFITACLFVQLCSHSRVCSLGKSYQERLSLFLLRPEIKCAVLNQASTFHTTTKDNFLISHLITLLENLSPFRMSYDHPVTANVFDHCRAKMDI